MNRVTRSVLILLLSAVLVQGVYAQALYGKGFIPDENGTNLDEIMLKGKSKGQSVVVGESIKDCLDCPEMIIMPAGQFTMGSFQFPDEMPPHEVNVLIFLLAKTEVTRSQWRSVMGTDPSKGSNYFCSTCPVDNVSWNDIQEFIVRLNRKTGKKHRLPSEAEWEYAARAGTTTNSAIGIDQTSGIKGDNSTTTEPVGREKSNAFGLFDMHGNVWEWVADCWHENYVEAPPNGSAWLNVCLNDARVLRGGSRYSGHLERRSATRLSYPPDTRTNSFGFRLARDHN